MAFATRQELLNIEDISAYEHEINIDVELQRSESAIIRLLNTIWWQKFQLNNPHLAQGHMDPGLLVREQWTNPTIYYALAYHILPKLSGDWVQKTADYHYRWEYKIRTLQHFGISYDVDKTTLRFVPATETFEYTRLRK
jgi:hypothetical protein